MPDTLAFLGLGLLQVLAVPGVIRALAITAALQLAVKEYVVRGLVKNLVILSILKYAVYPRTIFLL